jgi:hypothetical protein
MTPGGCMTRKDNILISNHAITEFTKRAKALGLNSDKQSLIDTFQKAAPEKSRNKEARWHLFKREILKGKTDFYVYEGWRFVVANQKIVTVERIKPHENYFVG